MHTFLNQKAYFSFKSRIKQIIKTIIPATGKAIPPFATSRGFTGDNK